VKTKQGIEVTIGCDPEFFLRKNFRPVSAHEFLPTFGGKYNPLKVDCGAVQVDGTAIEFNIDPAHTAAEFVHNIDAVKAYLRMSISKEYDFKFDPVQMYDTDTFAKIPDDAKELGCEPDFDAYTLEPNPKPDVTSTMRTASGHIHVGWTDDLDVTSEDTRRECAALVKQLDAILYPASLTWDSDTNRRRMYGKPGAFRPKKYGVEYRVLSNAWLKHQKIQEWIFEATTKAFELLVDGVVFDDAWRGIEANTNKAWNYIQDFEKLGIPRVPNIPYSARM
jgi:hypothetical protein